MNDLIIKRLPNGMINVPAGSLAELGIDPGTAAALVREAKLDKLRAERNRRIAVCDWTQLSDAPLTAEQKAAWAGYRQALRDLPESATDLDNLSWPAQPV